MVATIVEASSELESNSQKGCLLPALLVSAGLVIALLVVNEIAQLNNPSHSKLNLCRLVEEVQLKLGS